MDARRWFWRGAHVAGLCFLFLPFATLTTCEGNRLGTYTGYETIGHTGEGAFLAEAVLLGVLLLIVSWLGVRGSELRRTLRAFLAGGRGFLAALAFTIVLALPALSRAEIGKWLYGGYWAAVVLDALILALWISSQGGPPLPLRLPAPIPRAFFLLLTGLVIGAPLVGLILGRSAMFLIAEGLYSLPLAVLFQSLRAGLARSERWAKIACISLSALIALGSGALCVALFGSAPAWIALFAPVGILGVASAIAGTRLPREMVS